MFHKIHQNRDSPIEEEDDPVKETISPKKNMNITIPKKFNVKTFNVMKPKTKRGKKGKYDMLMEKFKEKNVNNNIKHSSATIK